MAVIIASDWKIEEVGGRRYGMCYCRYSPPFDRFDCEQGFELPNPTGIRVAAQALMWALESIVTHEWINHRQDTVIVSTKHIHLYNVLNTPTMVAKWLETGRWPKSMTPCRTLVSKCFSLLKAYGEMREDFVTLVYVEREYDDIAEVDLDEDRTEEGFDMETHTKKGSSQEEIQKAFQETRMRGVLAEKLARSGARCYRQQKKTR